jgi:hypothetical protein
MKTPLALFALLLCGFASKAMGSESTGHLRDSIELSRCPRLGNEDLAAWTGMQMGGYFGDRAIRDIVRGDLALKGVRQKDQSRLPQQLDDRPPGGMSSMKSQASRIGDGFGSSKRIYSVSIETEDAQIQPCEDQTAVGE